MAEPEHIDEGVDMGLRSEVDAGAHMAQGGVDVCGICGTQPVYGLFVHLGFGILPIFRGLLCPH